MGSIPTRGSHIHFLALITRHNAAFSQAIALQILYKVCEHRQESNSRMHNIPELYIMELTATSFFLLFGIKTAWYLSIIICKKIYTYNLKNECLYKFEIIFFIITFRSPLALKCRFYVVYVFICRHGPTHLHN